MSADDRYTAYGHTPLPARVSPPIEPLFELLHGHTRIRCELVDLGEFGIEARFIHNEEPIPVLARTFAPWHVAPFTTPRAAAIAWATKERAAIEAGH